MFSTGNIMPDSKMTGIMNITPDMSKAATCVEAMVEMSNHKVRARVTYRMVTHITSKRRKEKGMPSTV